MAKINVCVLTGYRLDESVQFDESNPLVVDYKFTTLGRAKIALSTAQDFINKEEYYHPILAGICRNAFENDTLPPLINTDFLINGIKNEKYPKSFDEKALHLLRFLFNKGGKEFRQFTLNSNRDYPICYCDDMDEFNRIMDFLDTKYWIKWGDKHPHGKYYTRYHNTQLTEFGIAEINKELPQIPLIGLVDQQISTGDLVVDNKINHAKDLFFKEPATIENMRSACENLSFVLEPLRKELSIYLTDRDVNDFFQIVNTFDIRHNKDHTKSLKYEEQLEWVFYSLLNTINTYTKIKKRLN